MEVFIGLILLLILIRLISPFHPANRGKRNNKEEKAAKEVQRAAYAQARGVDPEEVKLPEERKRSRERRVIYTWLVVFIIALIGMMLLFGP